MNLILCNAQTTSNENNNADLQSNKHVLMKTKTEDDMNTDAEGIDDLSDDSSSPDSDNFDDSDLLANSAQDDITSQLAAAGKFDSVRTKIRL